MSHILELIERQIAAADIRNRLEGIAAQAQRYVGKDGVAFGPCLLISRECGAGGGLLAQRAGERLGWNVFDARIVDQIAQAAHVHQRLVESVDEHIHSRWEQTWRELLLDDLPDRKYLYHLREIILTLGHQGRVVIVGRGAQYFLPAQCALGVRLVAPLGMRIKRVAERAGLSPEQARAKIKAVDAERAAFVRKIFKQDIGSPLHQDLIINTGAISIESATKAVMGLIRDKFGETETRPL